MLLGDGAADQGRDRQGRDARSRVFATTFIKGKIVYYYLYSPYRSAQTVTSLLARHKLNVAALLQANKKMAQVPRRKDRAWHLAAAR